MTLKKLSLSQALTLALLDLCVLLYNVWAHFFEVQGLRAFSNTPQTWCEYRLSICPSKQVTILKADTATDVLQVFVRPQLLHTCYPSRYFT